MALKPSHFNRNGLVYARRILSTQLPDATKAVRLECEVDDLPILQKALASWLMGMSEEKVAETYGPAQQPKAPTPPPAKAHIHPDVIVDPSLNAVAAAQMKVMGSFNALRRDILAVTDILTDEVAEVELLDFIKESHARNEWRSHEQLAKLLYSKFLIYNEPLKRTASTAANPT